MRPLILGRFKGDNMSEEITVYKGDSSPVVVAEKPSFMQLMAEMSRGGATPDQLEKLMVLNERHEKNEARKAFYLAMASFKSNVPTIIKDATVDYSTSKGRTHYKHSTLSNILKTVNPYLSENGLYAAWNQGQSQAGITVTCVLSHELGHSESTSLTSAADSSGGKNSIQAIGSTNKYLERYTLLALLGLSDQEDDDDGKASDPPRMLDEKRLSEIFDLVEVKIINPSDYLSYCQNTHGVGASFDIIPEKSYQAIRSELASMPDKQVAE